MVKMSGLESKIGDIYRRRINSFIYRKRIFLLAAAGLALGSYGCESDSSTTHHKDKEDTHAFASWPDDKKQDVSLYSDTCQKTFFPDKDGDGYGDKSGNIFACEKPEGYVDNFLDCDDNNIYFAPGAKEICDLKDNNCDGVIDESGACICIDNDFDGFSLYNVNDCPIGNDCDDENKYVHPNLAEACDGIDNNCDGSVDEGCGCDYGATQKCGFTDIGKCEYGTQTCTNGTWGPCLGEIKSMSEECDNLDNNCDGKTDENLTKACSTICGSGVETCMNGVWKNCNASTPTSETCNGKDDDCDGKVDDTLEKYAGCGPNGDGQQKQICNNGSWVNSGSCLGGGVCQNGETLDQLCGSDTGECQKGTQYKTCSNGQWGSWGTCQGEVKSKNETCNNKDDDCDGTIDESLTQTCSSACGSGIETCVSGVWKNCSAPQPSAEVCDDKDNDCDGKIDEGDICSGEKYCVEGKCTLLDDCVEGENGGLMCVINSFASPSAYPSDLAWDGEHLWCVGKDSNSLQKETIYQVSKKGEVISSFLSPYFKTTGLAWDGEYLWVGDYDGSFSKVNTFGEEIGGWTTIGCDALMSLGWDGQFLWMINDCYLTASKLVTTEGNVIADIVETFNLPDKWMRGLAWDGEYFWLAKTYVPIRTINKLNSEWQIINSFDSPAAVPWGLTWDGEFFWHADAGDEWWKKWGTIYQLKIFED
ncbi:putative metal-binding motif-containing protein [Candidatus Woesearchaeota archaeon]|nr:putative metal-binding motif-containing protein [Candidatus Woesearchaeota archaeon]